MEISKIKMFFLAVFGGKEKVADYLLDIANTAVQSLIDGNKDKWNSAYSALVKVDKFLVCLGWAVPKAWIADYNRIYDCIYSIVAALEDGELTKEEAVKIGESFRLAYANWRSAE